jgi:hypothetical protein
MKRTTISLKLPGIPVSPSNNNRTPSGGELTKSRTSRATRANVLGGKFSDELFMKLALLVLLLAVRLLLILSAEEVAPAPLLLLLMRLPPRIMDPERDRADAVGSNEGLADITPGSEEEEEPSMLMLVVDVPPAANVVVDVDVVGEVVEEADAEDAATSTAGEDDGDCCWEDMMMNNLAVEWFERRG